MHSTPTLLLLALLIVSTNSQYAKQENEKELVCPTDYVVTKIDNDGTHAVTEETENSKQRTLQFIEHLPLHVLRQGGDFVEFLVRNTTWFGGEIETDHDQILFPQHIFTNYASDSFMSEHCILDENMAPHSSTDVIRASCIDTPEAGNIALVRIFARFPDESTASSPTSIPKCCHDPYPKSAASNKLLEYVFEINCDVSCDDPIYYEPEDTDSPIPASTSPSAIPTPDVIPRTTCLANDSTEKSISSLSRDLVVASLKNGPFYGARHSWAWPSANNKGCGRYSAMGPGTNGMPCFVDTQLKNRVLAFDSEYMNFEFSFDEGMTATMSLSDKAEASADAIGKEGSIEINEAPSIKRTAISFFPAGEGGGKACSPPSEKDDYKGYPIRLVRSGRYLHHWYFNNVGCNGDSDTRIELKVTPDCVEVYSISNNGAEPLYWLDASTKEKLGYGNSASSNGFAGVSYCVRCESELDGSSGGSGNNEQLSGCGVVLTPIPTDCCPLTATNGDGSTLCGSGWNYESCDASNSLMTTPVTQDVIVTSKNEYPVLASGHSFEIRVDRQTGNQLSNVATEFEVTNNSETWKKVKLQFHIDNPRRHTGAAGILRDPQTEEPTGIHVQMSKNWHVGDALYDGYWWTGVAHIRVPPGTSISLELVVAYQYYKSLHGVSHSQLSLIGWGVNGLWEEVGLGANGESITYEPHGHHRRQMILDTRPWLVCQMNQAGCRGSPDSTQWTENHGGGDFLNAVNNRGMYQYLVGDTSYHTMNGPRLTNATFAGTTVDGNIAVSRTVSTWTTDDFVRHLHSFKYTFLEDTAGNNYPRFALYTLGGDNYNYIRFPLFAYGMGEDSYVDNSLDGSGVLSIKSVLTGVNDFRYLNDYYRVDAPIGCSQNNGDNDSCWFAMVTDPDAQVHHRGNRGIIVRNFHGRLNGEPWPPSDLVSPFAFHLIKSRQNNAAKDTVSIELALPSEFLTAVDNNEAQFQAGDYLTADIELMVPPRQNGDYYGNSNVLRMWMNAADVDTDYSNGWKIVAKEAVAGDALRTSVFEGSLERKYPPRVHVDCVTDGAIFNIAIPDEIPGILPITIAGVGASTAFSENLLDRPLGKLWRYIVSRGAWEEMGTNGSYQLEKDVLDNSHTYVYSLRLEFENDPVGTCEQFAFGEAPPLVANPPCEGFIFD